jgi:hypothetical protein
MVPRAIPAIPPSQGRSAWHPAASRRPGPSRTHGEGVRRLRLGDLEAACGPNSMQRRDYWSGVSWLVTSFISTARIVTRSIISSGLRLGQRPLIVGSPAVLVADPSLPVKANSGFNILFCGKRCAPNRGRVQVPSEQNRFRAKRVCRLTEHVRAKARRIAANSQAAGAAAEELSPLVRFAPGPLSDSRRTREGMGEAVHGRRGASCGIIPVGQPDGFDRARTDRT